MRALIFDPLLAKSTTAREVVRLSVRLDAITFRPSHASDGEFSPKPTPAAIAAAIAEQEPAASKV